MTTRNPHRRSLSATFLLTTALGTILGLNGALLTAAQADSGLPCVMTGGSCVISTDGINGNDGPDAQGDEPGHDGTMGSGASDLSTVIDDAAGLVSSGEDTSPVTITANGGRGGHGGNADASHPLDENRGGNGMPGSDGGTVNATLGPNTSGIANAGTGGAAIDAITITSIGGDGGGGGLASYMEGDVGDGVSAAGGNGLDVTATVGGTWQSNVGNGLTVLSQGGTGGEGKSTEVGLVEDGTPGGTGGNAGDVVATVTGSVTGYNYGVSVISAGGDGGQGGDGLSTDGASGGNGGNAGNAGNASATIASGAYVETAVANAAAVLVGSFGGAGGAGGGGSDAGSAGSGGNAGNVSAEVNGEVVTWGFGDSYGVLVQSVGGVGGDGGHSGSWFNPTNGNGNQGGDAGTATITGTGATVTTGTVGIHNDNETAVLAQSVGGGGGVGASSTDGWFAVGGNGGSGAAGGEASATLTGATVTTYGYGSAGIVAQSIGGGGGTGGNALSSSGIIVNMVVGGTGGSGGDAGDATAANQGNGRILTHNDNAAGVVLQSVGGGGGRGGAGYGSTHSGVYGASISVGGSGGSGGDGGTVNAGQISNNTGSIVTLGSESIGILGQSIGGGGGAGGASTARSIVYAGGDFPGLSLALSTGGTGGDGGDASSVYLENSALVATTGNGAAGLVGQAIGGGGGTGGDSSGSASASGGSFDFSASASHGGNGGGAGHGGDVTGINTGLIITSGESADGMLVQSIGGGGGWGGAGSALSSTGEQRSVSTEIGLGGRAGGGGAGYMVTAENAGAILTLGDGAHGMVAQTIGGGGGRGGGAAASNSGTIGIGVAVGGSGGDGGDTYYNGSGSSVTNSGTIVTFGADAGGILAQSIGGGGGAGGTAGTTMGSSLSNNDGSNGSSATTFSTVTSIAETVYNDGQNAVSAYNNVTTLLSAAGSMLGVESSGNQNVIQYLDDTASAGGDIDVSNISTSNHFNVAVGGTGGAGGAGGMISVTNSGTVATMGIMSDAVVVQSIGGGGGTGGGATTASSESWSSPGVHSGVTVGGGTQGASDNPNATNGSQASITNTGTIYTTGALAGGLIAQSIGMGGGIGGSSTVTNTDDSGNEVLGFSVSVGGSSAAANGISEAASVTSSGAIQTLGHDSYGIIAQSVSGGGGIVKTVAANLDIAGGSETAGSSKDFTADISLGTDDEVRSGNSGAAIVQTLQGGTITTSGDNGIGILAQSVAGGGGLALGGLPNGDSALDFLGGGGKEGSVNLGLSLDPDDNSGVIVEVGDNITTSGRGGVGVFAQSVGGGGGIAGDIGLTMETDTMGAYYDYAGSGGDVSVTVDQRARITTTGQNSAGIIAQSVGGGGGWITTRDVAYVGSAGGSGDGNSVIVTVNGAVDAQGAGSAGIFVQSAGGDQNGGSGTGAAATITIGSVTNTSAVVMGGDGGYDLAAGVYIADGTSTNGEATELINYGVLGTHDTTDGSAVFSGAADFEGFNYGLIVGNIHVMSGTINNYDGGTIHPFSSIDLAGGDFVNDGTLDLTGGPDETRLTGSYLGGAGSTIAFGADFLGGTSDHLTIEGDAVVSTNLAFRPTTLVPTTATVLAATGSLELIDSAIQNRQPVFTFSPVLSGNTLLVTPEADFLTSGLDRDEASLAAHLQHIWDGTNPGALAHAFAALSTVEDQPHYETALDMLMTRQIGAIATARVDSSRAFVANMNSCPVFVDDSLLMRESNCLWARGIDGRLGTSGNSSAAGFDAEATTVQIGGQFEAWENIFVVGSIAQESSNLTSESGISSANGTSLMGGVGLKYQSGPLLASAMIDIGRGTFDSTRLIVLGDDSFKARGNPDASNAGLHGRLSYQLPYDGFYLRPSVDLNASYVSLDGYSERGAGEYDLDVEGTDGWVFAATPAIEIGTRIDAGKGTVLRPYLGLGATFTSGNDWEIESRFRAASRGDAGFTSTVDNPDTLGIIRAGVEVMSSGNFDASLQYTGSFGDGYSASAGALKLTWRF